jgi:di/tricarboxylate transporter
LEYLTLFVILAAALALLVTNRMPPDGVGLAVMLALMFTGTASPAQALIGFAHPATLTVASVLILSAGVQRTGITDGLALWMRRHSWRSEGGLLRLQSGLVASMSAFVSNTATVAVFLPVTLSVARDRNFSPSRYLIPLSYASLLGGMCTVIGTSTNIVVASLVTEHGLRPLGMFEFFPVGIVLTVIGILYLTALAPKLMPTRRPGEDLATAYHLRKYLTEVEIVPRSHLAGRTLEKSHLSELYDLDVLEIHRGEMRIPPSPNTVLLEHDVLLVGAPLATIRAIQETEGIRLRSEMKSDVGDILGGGMVLAEAVVPPGSPLENRSLKQSAFRNKYGVTALALYHHRETIRERVGRIPLAVGDVLLLYGPKSRLRALAGFSEVLSVVQILPPRPRRRLGKLSVLVVALTVTVAATGVVSLVKAVVGGAALMVFSGCLTLRETYRAIDRRTIFLLAGMISLGLTMERTGAARFIAQHVMEQASGLGPVALLGATYLTTVVLTEMITNNACAVIMTPIAIAAARDFGLDPRPFALAVAFGASASFLTPFGYQTNMFVYGPGGYRFTDFARVGFPLTLICLVVVVIMVPWIWPLVPAHP